MRLNPRGEAEYRARLAQRYLSEAEEAFKLGNYRLAVSSSQLSVKNSAKAVIALSKTPSWSHDPSYELIETIQTIPEELREKAQELARIARTLAPEHGRVTYGEPIRGLTPWEIYNKEDAEEAIQKARRAKEIMDEILQRYLG